MVATVLAAVPACRAESLTGTVVDAVSREGIANAMVQEAGTGNVALTDGRGKFSLEVPALKPNNAVVIRKGGCATRGVNLTPGDTSQMTREAQMPGPSAALFANPYYVALRNFYVAPPPAGRTGNGLPAAWAREAAQQKGNSRYESFMSITSGTRFFQPPQISGPMVRHCCCSDCSSF